MKNYAFFQVSGEYLRQVLHLPDGTQVIEVMQRPGDRAADIFRIYISHPSFVEVPEDAEPHRIQPVLQLTEWGVNHANTTRE
ncbi:MAG: hypothetical protein GWN93_09720 [Deltaproteobacteria bacterium]|nr:hypothetical protein [Deltaproteobacteria bacterium]